MSTIAEFDIDASTIALGPAIEACPDCSCAVERVIAAADRGLWFEGVEADRLEAALRADPTVAGATHVGTDQEAGRRLYDVTIDPAALDVFERVLAHGGTVLSAGATDCWWHLRVRFRDREDASQLYDHLEDRGATLTLCRLTDSDGMDAVRNRLTDKQFEALVAALEHGYFTIPRETSLEELATRLDVSHQALSERLRRAYRALVVTQLQGSGPVGALEEQPMADGEATEIPLQ